AATLLFPTVIEGDRIPIGELVSGQHDDPPVVRHPLPPARELHERHTLTGLKLGPQRREHHRRLGELAEDPLRPAKILRLEAVERLRLAKDEPRWLVVELVLQPDPEVDLEQFTVPVALEARCPGLPDRHEAE